MSCCAVTNCPPSQGSKTVVAYSHVSEDSLWRLRLAGVALLFGRGSIIPLGPARHPEVDVIWVLSWMRQQ